MRIVFVATHPQSTSGYGVVGHRLTQHWAELGHQIYYFAYHGLSEMTDRPLHPNIVLTDVARLTNEAEASYGMDRIAQYVENTQPDVLWIYNDLIVVARMLNALLRLLQDPCRAFKLVVYLDLVYRYEHDRLLRHVQQHADHVAVFSACWRRHLCEELSLCAEDQVTVIPHGVPDSTQGGCSQALRLAARQAWQLAQDDFVVFNLNRNSYRKGLDLTIRGFLLLLVQENLDQHLKLFLHCNFKARGGYDILELIRAECQRLQLDYHTVLNHHLLQASSLALSDEQITILHHACDVGINTCIGEGFGLTAVEGAIAGRPQVVSAVGPLVDIFGVKELQAAREQVQFLLPPVAEFMIADHIDGHGGLVELVSPDNVCTALSAYYHHPEWVKEHGALMRQRALDFSWTTAFVAADAVLQKVQ